MESEKALTERGAVEVWKNAESFWPHTEKWRKEC